MASSGIKGNMLKLQTFMKWGVNNVFGHKTKECDSIIYVNEGQLAMDNFDKKLVYELKRNNVFCFAYCKILSKEK